MDFEQEIKKELKKILKKEVKLEIPPDSRLGDYSFPCFELAKDLKKDPNRIAKELSEKIINKNFRVENKGPYLNFFVDKEKLIKEVLSKILTEKEKYGILKKKRGKVMIEFSQANTHKAFHIGHIRGTSLGESLARILEFTGHKVIRVNYQGDTGMHVAKWLWCYNKFHKNEKFPRNNVENWIASIYVEAVNKLEENQILQEEVNKINFELEEGKNKKLVALWKKTRKLSLDAFDGIYKDLNTRFDNYFFEREVGKKGKEIANWLVKRKIARVDQGAVIVDLEKYNLGVWVLLRGDGTVLYSAKDIALAEIKFNRFKIDKSIYVVGAAQNLHIQQLFKTLELMGFKRAKNCVYIPVSEVRLPTGKMSSRTGENIVYSEFKKEIMDYAASEIKKRHDELNEKEIGKRALIISMAAIKFDMLKQDLNKTIIFSKEEALKFEGDTGPYLQYSYARAVSILKKARKKSNFKIVELKDKEIELIKKLDEFRIVVEQASNSLNPSLIANYSFQLAQIFNEFYHLCPVIRSVEEGQRLAIVKAFLIVMKSSLRLLGIEVMEEM